MTLNQYGRFLLTHLPTPIHPLSLLSAYFGGPEIWIKRDDCVCRAIGENKTHRLEFLDLDVQQTPPIAFDNM